MVVRSVKILAAFAALFAVGTFWGHEVLAVMLLAWLVFAALMVFALVSWLVGHAVCWAWDLL